MLIYHHFCYMSGDRNEDISGKDYLEADALTEWLTFDTLIYVGY